MNIQKFKQMIDLMATSALSKDFDVVVVVSERGRVGGTPAVSVRAVGQGIDWDHGKIMIYPEKALVKEGDK